MSRLEAHPSSAATRRPWQLPKSMVKANDDDCIRLEHQPLGAMMAVSVQARPARSYRRAGDPGRTAWQPSPTGFNSRGWDNVRPVQSLRRNTQHTWGGWPESRPVRVPPVCRHRSRTNAPESAHTSTATTSAGGASQPAGRSASAAFMNCAHRGAASSDAYPSVMIVRGWSNPIHTPAASSGVNPTNQASL